MKKNYTKYENPLKISETVVLQKYIQADLVVFISTYEGFGIPIVLRSNKKGTSSTAR